MIDPKRPEDHVFKEICGAVVAWKFMGRLYKRFGMEDEFRNSDFLEMASLGTVCDVMDLQKDNRESRYEKNADNQQCRDAGTDGSSGTEG